MKKFAQTKNIKNLSKYITNNLVTVKDKLSQTKDEICRDKPDDGRKVFKIYRFSGVHCKQPPRLDHFEIDVQTCGPMVLDALNKIKDMDPSLSYRRSCREGICGSCAINLQGKNCLACITRIPKDKTIEIYPLPHMYVIRDLVVDMTHFFEGYKSIRPYLIKKEGQQMMSTQNAQSVADYQKMVGLYECVLCACCSTACPSYWWNGRRFLGPATLLHAYRWVVDSRDDDTERRLRDLSDDFKAFRCHTILNCSVVCPKNLHPGLVISKLKHLISSIKKKPEPEIHPMKFSMNKSDKNISRFPAKKC